MCWERERERDKEGGGLIDLQVISMLPSRVHLLQNMLRVATVTDCETLTSQTHKPLFYFIKMCILSSQAKFILQDETSISVC